MPPDLENRVRTKIGEDSRFRRCLSDYIATLRSYPEGMNVDEQILLANASRAEAMIASLAIPATDGIEFVAWIVENEEELNQLCRAHRPWWKFW